MYLILIIISVVAAYQLRGSDVFVISIINAIFNFWSLGVISNFKDDAKWPANNYDRVVGGVAILTTLGGIVLLIYSFFETK